VREGKMRIDTISVDNSIRELCARGMGKLNYRYLHSIKRIKNCSKPCQGKKHLELKLNNDLYPTEFKLTFGTGQYMYEFRKYFSIYLCAVCLTVEKDCIKRYVSSCIDDAFRWENAP